MQVVDKDAFCYGQNEHGAWIMPIIRGPTWILYCQIVRVNPPADQVLLGEFIARRFEAKLGKLLALCAHGLQVSTLEDELSLQLRSSAQRQGRIPGCFYRR